MVNRENLGLPMSLKDAAGKKLQQATCDKTELNRRILRWYRCLKEVQTFIEGSHSKKKR